MNVRVIGPANSPGLALLQQCLRAIPGVNTVPDGRGLAIHWGSVGSGLNGKPAVQGSDQLQRLKDADINVPDFTLDPETAAFWVAKGLMVFGRLDNHTQGKDILGPTQAEFYNRDYWVKMIPNITEEWRIHVVGERSVARGKKIFTGRASVPPCVRSRRRGWTMIHNVEPSQALRQAARAAVVALGYNFGAVDLVLTDKSEVFVLEVNKQPGLDNYTANSYAAAFVDYERLAQPRRLQPGRPRARVARA